MDLVGVDTGFEVSKSFYELSFGEPRWRPSPITARYVAAGCTGARPGAATTTTSAAADGGRYRDRRTRRRWSAAAGAGEGVVVISGEGVLAGGAARAAERGRLRGAQPARSTAAACCRR